MKKLGITILSLSFILLLSCGDSGSSVNSDEVNAISSALTGCVNDIPLDDVSIDETASINTYIPVNYEYNCVGGGHITSTGNITGSCDEEGDCTFTSALTFYVSDPTNNLNDCDVGSGVILDGSLVYTMSGSSSGSTYNSTATLLGTIGINRRGDAGGLTPITDDCWISLNYSVSSSNGASASGSICGHDVSTD